MTPPLRKQMIVALQLSGKGEPTQEAYVREVRLLAQWNGYTLLGILTQEKPANS